MRRRNFIGPQRLNEGRRFEAVRVREDFEKAFRDTYRRWWLYNAYWRPAVRLGHATVAFLGVFLPATPAA